MPRVLILIAAALLIVWQGGCLTIRDGALVNRCGLWQFATGRAVVIAVQVISPQPAPPIAVYRGDSTGVGSVIMSGSPTITYGPKSCAAIGDMDDPPRMCVAGQTSGTTMYMGRNSNTWTVGNTNAGTTTNTGIASGTWISNAGTTNFSTTASSTTLRYGNYATSITVQPYRGN